MPRDRRGQVTSLKAVSIYIDDSVLKDLRAAAFQDRRSLSSEVLVFIEAALRDRRARQPADHEAHGA